MKKTIEDKKLIAINTYLDLFLSTLEEVVKDNGDIYLRESGDIYAKVWIQKKSSQCWVDWEFWRDFSELFSLEFSETQSFITRWVEDTYQLKGIYTIHGNKARREMLKIPTM